MGKRFGMPSQSTEKEGAKFHEETSTDWESRKKKKRWTGRQLVGVTGAALKKRLGEGKL